MNAKFYSVAATEQNPNWNSMIQRQESLYKRPHDIRSEFERDYNRIIYCNAYRRLKHKTQVFYSPKNDHICTRIEHVNNVEATSYTIAKALGLDTSLTRAISIGHDIGHGPFGHQGEKILNRFMKQETSNSFWHERNGLTFVDSIELLEDTQNQRQNLNLTYAVRDGIISHCGEIDENGLKPRKEAIDLNDYQYPNQYSPYTWEGCAVKIADKISYLGRDIQDAISLGILDKNLNKLYQLLEYPTGKTINNSNMINEFIYDLCQNSDPEKGLCFSDKTFQVIQKLKEFNYQYIYLHPMLQPSIDYFNLVLTQIYQLLKNAYDGKNTLESLQSLFPHYPNTISSFIQWIKCYWNLERNFGYSKNKVIFDMKKESDYAKAIVTYISGMTDNYAIETYHEIIRF